MSTPDDTGRTQPEGPEPGTDLPRDTGSIPPADSAPSAGRSPADESTPPVDSAPPAAGASSRGDQPPVETSRPDADLRSGTGPGAHAAPRPVPPSGREAPRDDVVLEDLRTDARRYDADSAIERGYGGTAPPSPGPTASGGSDQGTPGASAPTAATAATAHPDAHGTGHAPREADHDRDHDHDHARTREPDRRSDEAPRRSRVAAEPPPRAGIGRHLLGVVLGLVLTPFAFLLTGIGGARLADIAGTTRMGSDTLGIVLLALGVAMLALLVLLGAWSATVPITGGVVWGLALGIAYLVAPRDVEATVENVGGSNIPAAVDQFAQSAMSGMLLLVGVLLVTAGLATAFARRAGRRYGAAVTQYRHEQQHDPVARAEA